MCDFSVTVDGCKFCTVKDKNFKFSENAELLVCCRLGLAIVPLCRGTGAPFDEHRAPPGPFEIF